MTKSNWRTPVVILIAGTLALFLSLGVRQTYGLFLPPISAEFGWGRETFSYAVALQSVFWGLGTPFAGVIADRYGPGRVLAAGGILYALGLVWMALGSTAFDANGGIGVLTGLAMSATMFPIVLTIVGRVAPPGKRNLYLGIASAGGSSGQVILMSPMQFSIDTWGWSASMLLLALMAGLITPLAAAVAGTNEKNVAGQQHQSVGGALKEAANNSGYWLVSAGYFVCGFQTMFISMHLPALIGDNGIDPGMAAYALSLIGFFNIIGCFVWGAMGAKYRNKYCLVAIYLGRSVVMALFYVIPMTETSLLIFGVCLGLVWLGTVPLTSAVVAQIFGTKYLSTLFGLSFVSHQVGSFLGIWIAGRLYDQMGNYDVIWWLAVASGLVAALLNFPIKDQPVARLNQQQPATAKAA
jgi:MFS family permease